MSFDMKYNKDGMPVKSAQVEQSLNQSAFAIEQPTQEIIQNIIPESESIPDLSASETEITPDLSTSEVEVSQEPPQAKNFRAIKDRAERAERERDEYFRILQQQELAKQPKQQVETEEDLNLNMDADALVEGKHLSKVDKKIKLLEQKLAQYEQRSTESNAETRLRSQYSDFDSVVTRENINELRDQFPELAQSLGSTKDLYTQGKSAYLMLKKFGIVQDPQIVAEKALVQKNAAKPRPLTSISPQQGNTPLSQANAFANGLTKELREQLNREVSEARRNL